jgi:cytoskeletal protein RodZ
MSQSNSKVIPKGKKAWIWIVGAVVFLFVFVLITYWKLYYVPSSGTSTDLDKQSTSVSPTSESRATTASPMTESTTRPATTDATSAPTDSTAVVRRVNVLACDAKFLRDNCKQVICDVLQRNQVIRVKASDVTRTGIKSVDYFESLANGKVQFKKVRMEGNYYIATRLRTR